MRLPRSMRMRTHREFARVRRRGQSYAGKYIILGVLPDEELGDEIRFGIIVTKKVGKAHERNRVRRRIKGMLSRDGERIAPGHWLVFVGRRPSVHCSFHQLRHDWHRLGRKAGILPATSAGSSTS